MSRRAVWDAFIVILFDSFIMMPGENFCLFAQCAFIARKWLVYLEAAIAFSFFEVMSMAKVYLDIIVWSVILLLCTNVSLLVLLSLLSYVKLSVNPFIFFYSGYILVPIFLCAASFTTVITG